MESKDLANVFVAVRVRPLNSTESANGAKPCVDVLDGKVIAIRKAGDQSAYLKSQQLTVNEYMYDRVFAHDASNDDVYAGAAQPYMDKFVAGQNVTVFAYGATGAGKTHTMMGSMRADKARSDGGIIPRSLEDVFVHLQHMQRTAHGLGDFKLTCTYLEIYNEQVYDLLDGSGKVIAVREDQEKGVVVAAGATEVEVQHHEAIVELILAGNQRRKTEATMANEVSSRSHAVLQIVLKRSTVLSNGREGLVESTLSLIDLAGSERASATNNRGIRLQEGANINRSLLALANCINSLAERGKRQSLATPLNVKYRDSKLTHLLKTSLEGNCNIVMIANVSPSDITYEDTHNTLKYANRAKNIKVNPQVKETVLEHASWLDREQHLRAENQQLRDLVAQLKKENESLRQFQEAVVQRNCAACLEAVQHQTPLIHTSTSTIRPLPKLDTVSLVRPAVESAAITRSDSVSSADDLVPHAPSADRKLRSRRVTIHPGSGLNFRASTTVTRPSSVTAATESSSAVERETESAPMTTPAPVSSDDTTAANPRKRRASHLPMPGVIAAKRRSLCLPPPMETIVEPESEVRAEQRNVEQLTEEVTSVARLDTTSAFFTDSIPQTMFTPAHHVSVLHSAPADNDDVVHTETAASLARPADIAAGSPIKAARPSILQTTTNVVATALDELQELESMWNAEFEALHGSANWDLGDDVAPTPAPTKTEDKSSAIVAPVVEEKTSGCGEEQVRTAPTEEQTLPPPQIVEEEPALPPQPAARRGSMMRKKSMLKVSLMLDSLTKEVTGSVVGPLTALTVAPTSTSTTNITDCTVTELREEAQPEVVEEPAPTYTPAAPTTTTATSTYDPRNHPLAGPLLAALESPSLSTITAAKVTRKRERAPATASSSSSAVEDRENLPIVGNRRMTRSMANGSLPGPLLLSKSVEITSIRSHNINSADQENIVNGGGSVTVSKSDTIAGSVAKRRRVSIVSTGVTKSGRVPLGAVQNRGIEL